MIQYLPAIEEKCRFCHVVVDSLIVKINEFIPLSAHHHSMS